MYSSCSQVVIFAALLAGTLAVGQRGTPSSTPAPCCAVTQVDQSRHVATARHGMQEFEFEIPCVPTRQEVKVGQRIWANFKTQEVSLDGHSSCSRIVGAIRGTGMGRGVAGGTWNLQNQASAATAAPGGPAPEATSNPAATKAGSPGSKSSGHPGTSLSNVRSVDPCSLASTSQLQQVAKANLAAAFPITYSHNGSHLNIHDPQLSNLTCTPLHIEVSAAIRYRETRGFPQYSTSGRLRFGSPVLARIVSTAAAGTPVTASTFQSARLCLTDIHIDELNLNNVPNWLDNTWIRDYLNQQYGGMQKCNDVTALVAVYLQNGGTIAGMAPVALPAERATTAGER